MSLSFFGQAAPGRPPRFHPARSLACAAALLLAQACSDDLPTAPGGRALRSTSAAPTLEALVVAHQDDWELFMGDVVGVSVSAGTRTVLVYTTAGDAGKGAAYWNAREAASTAAADTLLGPGAWSCAGQGVNGHTVRRCAKGNVAAYYLRLPDGNSGDGLGYGSGSLKVLRDQATPVTALDGSTTYASWSDLTATLQAIVDAESAAAGSGEVRVNAHDYDRTANPSDHPDHWATADAVRAAATGRSWALRWYMGYNTQSLPANLSPADYGVKVQEFTAYDHAMVAAGAGSQLGLSSYQEWLKRTYPRSDTIVTPLPPITGTTYSTNFGEYATGAQPAGWSQAWDSSPMWKVADDTLAVGGKVLRWSATGQSRNRFGLAFDRFGELGDQSVYTEVRVRSLGGGTTLYFMGAAAVRMGGTADDEHGYAVFLVDNQDAGSRDVVLATWQNGGYVQLADLPYAWSLDSWYCVRLEAIGGHLRARVWPRGTAEPGGWPIDAYDTRYPTGRPGVSNHDNGTVEWDVWAADAAPPPPPPPTGDTWTDDFSADAAGAAPAGWTVTSYPSGITWTVASDPGGADGKVVRGLATETNRHILRFDAVPDAITDQEAVIRFRMGDADGYGPGIALRHTMSGGAESAYVAYLRTGTGEIEIDRFLSGGWRWIAATSFASTPGAWYLMRFGALGSTLRVRVWRDGTPEPGAWSVVANDNGIAAGSAGLYVYEPNTVDFDAFTLSTGGLTAPLPASPPPSATITQVVVKPDSASAAPGGLVQFTAYGRTSAGDSVAVTPTWSAAGGSITATGAFTAGSTPGAFQVSAALPGGSPSGTAKVVVTVQPPAAPGGLAATAASSGSIALGWIDNSTDEDGFTVERAPDAGGTAGTFTALGNVAAGTTSYTDASLSPATRYWYRVRAFNAGGASAYAPAASATTLPVPPAAPSGLAGQPLSGGTSAGLTWTDNSSTEDGFQVERAPDVAGAAGTYAQIASLPAGTTSYTAGSLAQGTKYWFRVRAFNAGGSSAYSNPASVTTPSLPGAPSRLTATTASASSIALGWKDNSTNEDGYTVERAPDVGGAPGAWAQTASLGPGATAYTSTGLTAGTPYWFRVRAFNLAGSSGYSNQASATTTSLAPTGLTLRGYRKAGVTYTDLTWVPGSPATVDVYRGGAAIATGVANSGAFTDRLGTVAAGTSFTYRVCSAGKTGATNCTSDVTVTF